MDFVIDFFKNLWESTGIRQFFVDGGWRNLIMILIAFVLIFLAIKKKFEPYLLLPIAFGMLLVNLPGVGKILFNKKSILSAVTMREVFDRRLHDDGFGDKNESYPKVGTRRTRPRYRWQDLS